MVKKYVKAIEGREYNTRTDSTWSIYDVPSTWKKKTEAQILADGYIFLDDGTAIKPEDVPEEEPVEETEVEETEAE